MTGLTELRELKAFKEYTYPRLERAIHDSAGFDVPVEVDWERLAEKGMGHMYVKNFTAVYFAPLVHALRQVTLDVFGENALIDNLQRIVIKNESGNFASTEFATFDDGVLTIDHDPHSNVDDIHSRVQALVQVLEAKL